MRILFVGGRPGYPQRMSGAAVSTYLLADLLARNGARVHHLCRMAEDGGILAPDARVQETPSPVSTARADEPLTALPATIAAFEPDLAVLSAGATRDIARALADHGIPIVVFQRDLGMEPLRELRGDGALLGIFACSDFVAREVKTRLGLTAAVLPNIFPAAHYRVPATGNLVTFINPVPAKGVDLVLDLAERHRDLPFLFVEGWKMVPRLKAAVLRRAAEIGTIRWQPAVQDMRLVYARTRVLLVPTRLREAWGRVVTEAQISGIPVIAADHGGLPESVGPGGLLLPPDDRDAWSRALRRLMTDRNLWADLSGKAAAHAARGAMDPNRIVAQFVCQIRDWQRRAVDIRVA